MIKVSLEITAIAADLVGDTDGRRKLRDTEDLLALVTCARDPLTHEQLRYLFGARDDDAEVESADALADALNHRGRIVTIDWDYKTGLFRAEGVDAVPGQQLLYFSPHGIDASAFTLTGLENPARVKDAPPGQVWTATATGNTWDMSVSY